MKTLLILTLLLPGCSTTIKSPLQIEYTGYIKQEGVGVSIKPPGWQWGVNLYKWVTEEDGNE